MVLVKITAFWIIVTIIVWAVSKRLLDTSYTSDEIFAIRAFNTYPERTQIVATIFVCVFLIPDVIGILYSVIYCFFLR